MTELSSPARNFDYIYNRTVADEKPIGWLSVKRNFSDQYIWKEREQVTKLIRYWKDRNEPKRKRHFGKESNFEQYECIGPVVGNPV